MDDLISRQAAIDALDFEIVYMTAYCDGKNEGNPLAQYNKGLEDGKKAIKALPSAQPYTAEEIQKMQELESVQVEKAYELGRESAQPEWIPVMDGDGVLPEVDEDGYSDYVLVSFSNVFGLDIGQYREDENGGAFYSGDDDDPYTKIGVFVNAWMPLPKPYRGGGTT